MLTKYLPQNQQRLSGTTVQTMLSKLPGNTGKLRRKFKGILKEDVLTGGNELMLASACNLSVDQVEQLATKTRHQ